MTQIIGDDLKESIRNVMDCISDEYGNGQSAEELEQFNQALQANLVRVQEYATNLFDEYLHEIELYTDNGLDVDDLAHDTYLEK